MDRVRLESNVAKGIHGHNVAMSKREEKELIALAASLFTEVRDRVDEGLIGV